jgi:hypothetical protein
MHFKQRMQPEGHLPMPEWDSVRGSVRRMTKHEIRIYLTLPKVFTTSIN